jgi:hypothetical protein
MSRETFDQLPLEHYCNQPYNLGNKSIRFAQNSLPLVEDPAAFGGYGGGERKMSDRIEEVFSTSVSCR